MVGNDIIGGTVGPMWTSAAHNMTKCFFANSKPFQCTRLERKELRRKSRDGRGRPASTNRRYYTVRTGRCGHRPRTIRGIVIRIFGCKGKHSIENPSRALREIETHDVCARSKHAPACRAALREIPTHNVCPRSKHAPACRGFARDRNTRCVYKRTHLVGL